MEQLNLLITERPALSVTELSTQIKRAMEGQFNQVKVRGEISGYKLHSSGHAYFALKDKDAVIDGVCWRGTKLGVKLEEGLEVIIQGRVTTYPGRSKYQIVVEQAESAGEGALLKLLMERKKRLQEEGLFNRRRPLPFFPHRIGVITSPTGAVIRDILHRISERFPTHVVVWPVAVQGEGAAEQITAAIQGFNTLEENQRPDVLIVARGGGSLEDLWAFNEEIVVRATAQSQIPIISAVGHETDTTLIDYAADLRAPTPTAAAEFVTPVLSQLVLKVTDTKQTFTRLILGQLENYSLKLKTFTHQFPDARSIIENATQKLDDWMERLGRSFVYGLSSRQNQMMILVKAIKTPREQLNQSSLLYEQYLGRFQRASLQNHENYKKALDVLAARLEQSSFNKILEKGFVLVKGNDGNPLTTSEKLKGQETDLELCFYDGPVRGTFKA